MKGMRGFFVLCLIVFMTMSVNSRAVAGDGDAMLNIMLKKGIITEEEYKDMLKALQAEEEDKQVRHNTQIAEAIAYNKEEKEEGWTDRISLSGLMEGEYRWRRRKDVSDKTSGSTSDLYMRRLELGVGAKLTDWMKADAVINSEFIGDAVNNPDNEANVVVDQATITLQREDFPLYLVMGKRAQPFGVFENLLVTDPMTQDAFETKRVGLTIGATGPWELDVSATLYKGEEQMDHLVGSGLFEVTRAGATAADNVNSYILSASVSPFKDHLKLFAGYLSEPGRGDDRNTTMNMGFNASMPGLKNLRLYGEYMKALQREKYDGLNEAFKEGIFSITAVYAFNHGDSESKEGDEGGPTFAERMRQVLEAPVELALRYEHFDDDDLAEKTASWSVEHRYSIGLRYPFYRDEEKGLAAFVATEYRHTDYRLHSSLKDVRADNNKEVFVKLGVAF